MSYKTGKKLLIVDDEAIIAYEKADMLRRYGFEANCVSSGEKAISIIKDDPDVSLVLMDIGLGKGMDGNEAAQAILQLRNVPIIFLTSYSDEKAVEKVRDIPRFGYVTKDSGDAVLISSIEMALRLFEYQKKLRESEERWSFAIEGSGYGVWDWNLETGQVYYSLQWKTMLGYEDNEIENSLDEWKTRVHPDDIERVYREIHMHLDGQTRVYQSEHRLRCKDGSYKWILDRGKVISRTEEGKPLRAVGTHTDVTERRIIENELMESKNRYHSMFSTMLEGFAFHEIICDESGKAVNYRFLDINPAFESLTGLKAEDVIGRTILDILPGIEPEWIERYGRVALTGTPECFVSYTSGIDKWFEVSAYQTRPGFFSTLFVDITDRTLAEKERARLATAIEQSAETIVITDSGGGIVYVNPAFEKITGYTRSESLGANPRILKSGNQDDAFYRSMWDTLAQGIVWSGRLINRKKDGSLFEEEATISPVKDESGAIINYVAVKRDITREVSLQNQLLQSQKMQAVGTLAGGIAHDFNNILQIIMGFSEILQRGEQQGTPRACDLERIMEAAKNGAELVKGLLTFSRKVEPRFVPLNVNEAVNAAIKLLERTFPRMIDIRTDLSLDLWEISADPTQMEQIIMNLSLNARDAMPDGGHLTFTTRNSTLDAENCRYFLGCRPGDYVHLAVEDTGCGMESETAEHIFEPFFTTKEPGSGTGLGLAIVYGIVQQHDGFISYSTRRGSGTTFDIYFNASKSVKAPEQANGLQDYVATGSETLLLADDEDSVRTMAERVLREAGYNVITADNGQKALEYAIRDRERISLVILDLSMPEMGGLDCMKKLVEAVPGIKILIMSGYAADADPDECLKTGAAGFLGKPFKISEMLQKVRELLNGSK
jgi:PAS domain S-box-containing protein